MVKEREEREGGRGMERGRKEQWDTTKLNNASSYAAVFTTNGIIMAIVQRVVRGHN